MADTVELMETLNSNATKAKNTVNQVIDEIIMKANQRREELLNEIDIITQRKTQMMSTLSNVKNIDETANTNTNHTQHAQINVDIYIDRFCTVLETIGAITDPNTHDITDGHYIKQIRHGLEGDTLLLSGYMRNALQQITAMPTTKDIEGLCLKYYSFDAHTTEQDRLQRNNEETQFDCLCGKMKDILGECVEEVIIDEFDKRQKAFPLRIIEHSLKESYSREPSKVTLAINPSERTMQTLKERVRRDPSDKTIGDLVWLLYETHLIGRDLALPDPRGFQQRILKLVKLGLAIFSDSESDSDTDSASYY